jgi:tetratricopeptide (TPR) repeat protein
MDGLIPFRHWDNIEGSPYWLAGEAPRYNRLEGLHTVALKPGTEILIRLPRRRDFCLLKVDGPHIPGELQVEISNGSSLFIETLMQAGPENSLCVTPTADGDRLVHLSRTKRHDKTIALALFISRPPKFPELADYRSAPDIEGRIIRLQGAEMSTPQPVWLVGPEQGIEAELEGPQRLQMESWLSYETAGSEPRQIYHLFAELDGVRIPLQPLYARPDLHRNWLVEGCPTVLGLLNRNYIDIPEGRHRLKVGASAPLLLRPLGRPKEGDFLLAGNRPRISAASPSPYQSAISWLSALGDLARDNRRKGNAALAVEAALNSSGSEALLTEVVSAVRSLDQRHGFFRPLLPVSKPQKEAVSVLWPAKTRLRALERKPLLIPQTLALALTKGVARQIFLTLPDRSEQAFRYALPARQNATRLQLLIRRQDGGKEGELFVQFDKSPPKKLSLKPGLSLPKAHYWPDSATAARILTEREAPTFPLTTAVSDLELLLPADVSSVRLWQSADNPQPLVAALGMRVAKELAANEAEYRPLISGLDPAEQYQLLRQSMQSIIHLGRSRGRLSSLLNRLPAEATDTERALLNDWLPLLRFLYSRYASFVASIERPMPAAQPSSDKAPSPQGLYRHAKEAMQEQDWVRAIELWSAIIPLTSGKRQRHALLQRVVALQSMGESYLAETLLRGMLIHETDPALKQQAADALTESYVKNRDDQALLNLVITRAIFDPRPERLIQLSRMLLKQGQAVWATKILLSIPAKQRPSKLMLKTSYTAGWWRTFDANLQQLTDPQLQAYWSGYRYQRLGQFDAALKAWTQAGISGSVLRKTLQRGLSIRQRLANREADRETLLQEWADWWENQPGEKRWRLIEHNITGFDGVEILTVPDQGQSFKTFRARPASPVTLTLQGPRNLRITTRLLHREKSNLPVDDWLLLFDGSMVRRIPINGDSVADGVRLTRRGGFAGRAHRFEFAIGPGSHQLTLSPYAHPQLVRIEALSPERPLSVLPEPLAHDLIEKTGRVVVSGSPDPFPDQDVYWVEACSGMQDSQQPVPFDSPIAVADDTTLDKATRISIELYAPIANQNERFQRMAQWLWQAEHYPEEAKTMLAQAEALLYEDASDVRLQGIIRRMRRSYAWQPLDEVVSSAGQHYMRQPLYQPESPKLRVRSALLAPLKEGERLVYGGQRITIAMQNPTSTSRITLMFKMEEIGYIDARELKVSYRVDDGKSRTIELTPENPSQRLQASIPRGRHLLRLEMLSPVRGQILRFGVRDDKRMLTLDRGEFSERAYHVSSLDEPVELTLDGPAWLRIDEAIDGQTHSRYLFVQHGWHEMELPPSSSRQESYYRLFRQRPLSESWRGRLRERHLYQPHMASAEKAPSPASATEPIRDLLPMSGQEDGTWNYYGRLVARRTLEEDRVTDEAERFMELGVTHHLFQEPSDLYLESGAFARLRRTGGSTLGLFGDFHWYSGYRAISLDLNGDLFLQKPKNEVGTEGSLLLQAHLSQQRELSTKTHHRPSLRLFQRWLSMDALAQGMSEYVDQDIYTRYKDEHQRGLRLDDTLTHYPWRDMRLRAGLSLTTNEALNPFDPDYADFTLGGDQLIRDLNLGLRYRWRRYFADDDRDTDSNQHHLRLRLDWRRWSTLQAGWHLGFDWDHQLDTGESSLFLTLRHYRANSRMFRDFRPGTVMFKPLRERYELERHFSSQEAAQ